MMVNNIKRKMIQVGAERVKLANLISFEEANKKPYSLSNRLSYS